MQINYSVAQQYIARILLVSLCLQSCGGGFDNNPIIPIQQNQTGYLQTDFQPIISLANIESLVDQQFRADSGYLITLYGYKVVPPHFY